MCCESVAPVENKSEAEVSEQANWELDGLSWLGAWLSRGVESSLGSGQ